MKGKWAFLSGMMLICASLQAQINGVVFEDKNGNGVQDAGEQGLPGVVVSNGREVTRTGTGGKYELPVNADTRFVSVTCPSGYRNTGKFYSLLKQEGGGYAFGICRNSGGDKNGFSFIQITDTELFKCFRGDWIDELKNYIKANPTAFLVHTGDICYERGMQFHARHLEESVWQIPYYSCIGNHDLVKGKYGEEMYESLFGPTWYSFDAGACHFVVLPMLGGDHAPSYSQGKVMEWLRNDLAEQKGKPVVVFSHDLWFQGEEFTLKNREGETLDLLQHRLTAWIYGHWHNHFYHRTESGVQTYSSSTPDKGGIDHGPACFRVFRVDQEGRLTSHTQYVGPERLLRMAVPCEGDVLQPEKGRIPVVVNTYRTASHPVKVRVGIERRGRIGKWLELAQATDWSWRGSLALIPGSYTLKTEAWYADGNRLMEQVCFKVDAEVATIRPGEDWGNLRGNAAHACIVKPEVQLPLRLGWVRNTGGNVWMASPVVEEGRVFVATMDDDRNEDCHVEAYDARTGDALWCYKTRNSVKNTIVCENGIVVACDVEGNLYGLKAATGDLLWELKLNVGLLPPCQLGLVVEHGIVYAGQGRGLTAVRLENGQKVWENDAWKGGEGTTSTFTLGDGVLVASSHWNALFGHDAKSGKVLWRLTEAGLRNRDGSATFGDGVFYVASTDHLFRINPKDGRILQQARSSRALNSACAPLVTDRYVIVATSDAGVSAYDRKTLEEVWNYQTNPALFYTVPYTENKNRTVEVSPVLIGNTVLFGASDGCLHAVDVETGVFQWKRDLGAPVLSSMAVSGNMLYVSDFAGNIYAFVLNGK
ncbi:MAG: PQQ-binding-like beta-propeller repeat protein [Odoribacter sp.]